VENSELELTTFPISHSLSIVFFFTLLIPQSISNRCYSEVVWVRSQISTLLLCVRARVLCLYLNIFWWLGQISKEKHIYNTINLINFINNNNYFYFMATKLCTTHLYFSATIRIIMWTLLLSIISDILLLLFKVKDLTNCISLPFFLNQLYFFSCYDQCQLINSAQYISQSECEKEWIILISFNQVAFVRA
jgi:hypothetical protein